MVIIVQYCYLYCCGLGWRAGCTVCAFLRRAGGRTAEPAAAAAAATVARLPVRRPGRPGDSRTDGSGPGPGPYQCQCHGGPVRRSQVVNSDSDDNLNFGKVFTESPARVPLVDPMQLTVSRWGTRFKFQVNRVLRPW